MRISKWIVILIVIALLVTMILPFLTAAAEGQGTSIRVALYIDTSSYHHSTDLVTLKADSGLILKDGSGKVLTKHQAGEEIRVSPYQFRVLVKETGNMGEAVNLVQRAEQANFPAQLSTATRNGGTVYRVEVGSVPTLSAAQSMAGQVRSVLGIGGEVLGTLAWEAGLFSKESEALARLKEIQNAGFDAHLALTANGQGAGYLVLAGNEATEGELNDYYQELTAGLPGISLAPLSNASYVILEEDPLLEGNGDLAIRHYRYSPQMKLWVAANGGNPSTVEIAEKGNTYRGAMEFSISNGRLALVNQLPLDEYLYGVVGAEMSTGWPIEALKAQAVIARTFAMSKGNRWGIANVVDTTMDQAYDGVEREGADIRRAVDETAGQVLTYGGKMIEALYSSNMGGRTADGSEVWGNDIPYLKPVDSPDSDPMAKAPKWYRIARENGQIGYVHSDYITMTQEKNNIGLPYGTVNTKSLNLRSGPGTTHEQIGGVTAGEYVTILETVPQDNPYRWIGGPVNGLALMKALNSKVTANGSMPVTQPVARLQVTQQGPSGRVMQIAADGLPIPVKYPDSYRSLFRDILGSKYDSTKFEIEEMGSYTVLGAGGKKERYPEQRSALTAIGAGGKRSAPNGDQGEFVLYNQKKEIRIASKAPQFRFLGFGYGHGLGLSQYGAKAMAEQGNDYTQILKHYYSDLVQIEKLQ